MVYFLKKIIPVCEECDVKMAVHPDDPPWGLFGLPRIICSEKDLDKLFAAVPSKYNGLTFCTDPSVQVAVMILSKWQESTPPPAGYISCIQGT